MGFLDHSTNNIIIDAVLTDHGRRLLAENQGSFKIAFFSLGDDEVDYTHIRKFGRTVGKEKISKNTPIFEAQTNSSQALKHRLITLPNPIVSVIPSMTFTANSGNEVLSEATYGSNTVKFSGAGNMSLSFKQTVGTGAVPAGLTDQTYTIMANERFLGVVGSAVKVSTQANTRIAAYTQVKSSTDPATNAASVDVTLSRSSAMTDSTTFAQFGDYSDPNQVTTVVSVIGDQSGLRKDIKVIIAKLNI